MSEFIYLSFTAWDGETEEDDKHRFPHNPAGTKEAQDYADCFLRTGQYRSYRLFSRDEAGTTTILEKNCEKARPRCANNWQDWQEALS